MAYIKGGEGQVAGIYAHKLWFITRLFMRLLINLLMEEALPIEVKLCYTASELLFPASPYSLNLLSI